MDEKRKRIDRRTFIKTSLVAGAGLALTSSINNFSWGASSGDDVLAEASLLDLSKMIRNGDTTSKKLVELYLERIQKFGGRNGLNAHITVAGDSALKQAEQLVIQEKRIDELEHQQAETTAQVKAIIDGENYFTVVGYANVIDIKVDKTTSSKIGKFASKLCRSKGWEIGTTLHPLYGHINSYPKDALMEAFEYFKGEIS